MNEQDNRSRRVVRVIRVFLMAVALLLMTLWLAPDFEPEAIDFRGILGGGILGGLIAAVLWRMWYERKNKRRK